MEIEVVRCVDCQRLVLNKEVRSLGMCPGCGNKRVKTVLLLTEKERQELTEKGVSQEFMDLFEEVEHE